MKRRESGTILVFALVMVAAGAIVLAGWISLLAARANYTEQMAAATKRRIVLENSRLLATQYLRQNVLAGTYTGTRGASIDGGEWARFVFTSTAAAVPLTSIDLPVASNLFSPGSDGGYTTDVSARLYADTVTSSDWTFHLRSRSPMLGFDLLTAQNPTLTPGATVTVSEKVYVTGNMLGADYLGGNAMIWPAATFSLTALTYQTPTGSAFTGRSATISNFPFPPVTSGTQGVTSGYNGMFSVIEPVSGGTSSLLGKAQTSPFVSVFSGSSASVDLSKSPPNATPVDGVSCDASKNVTIDLSTPALQRVYILGNGLGAPPKIILKGQVLVSDSVADQLPAILIVYVERVGTVAPLTTIELQGENNRRVHLAIKKEVGAQEVAIAPQAGTHIWRLMLTAENTSLRFTPDSSGALKIRGGIRSDNSVLVTGGLVEIARETDPKLLERNADRAAWLEAFAQ